MVRGSILEKVYRQFTSLFSKLFFKEKEQVITKIIKFYALPPVLRKDAAFSLRPGGKLNGAEPNGSSGIVGANAATLAAVVLTVAVLGAGSEVEAVCEVFELTEPGVAATAAAAI